MDDTQVLDCTQALPCDLDEEDEEGQTQHLVAWLEVGGNRHEVFTGRNIIGRDADGCRIVIPSKVLSKQHAAVEVRAGTHTLADLGSSNKTRLGNMVLRPHVQYALQGGEKIRFGNVMATYTIIPKVCDDSGSETGSESMLPMMEDEEERSPSPVLSSRLVQSDTQKAVQNSIDSVSVPVTSVSSQNSSTPQAKEIPSSPCMDTVVPHLTDSLLQPSDAESSVVSATQSPAGKIAPLSPSHTRRPDLEEYNSDASTDVEDNATVQPCPNILKPETPAHPSPTTSIPETPPHSSHTTTIANTPASSSPNTSIPETPAGCFPSISKTDTPCSLSNTSVPEIQACSSPNRSLPKAPVHPSPIAIVDTPARAHKDSHSGQGPDNEDLVFKKPLAASTLKASWSPNTPASVTSTPRSSAVIKDCGTVSTRLFPGDSSDSVDLDAPTQVFTSNTNVDLDAPTQVFTNDTSVDLDAPTQVFANDTSVDLDAPTQVFANDTSVDLDAPTQVFTNDTSVDLDAPTQVFTSNAPSDIDLDAPTQVFSSVTSVDLDAPTQVFTNDTSFDLDAPTQVFTSNAPSDIDLDAPTQVFDNDIPSRADLDVPTQVFNNDTSSDIDPDAPTQVFTSDGPSGIDPNAPTQVFTNDAPSGIDPDAPTQVFTSDAPSDIDPDAPTQVFTSDGPSGIDPNAPTQVFTNDTSSDIDPDAPTQVFTSDAPSDIDPDAPTQVFTSDGPSGIDPNAPTQVFTSDAPGDADPDAPTQVFTSVAPGNTDPDAPTQVFTSDTPGNTDPNAPTQVFTSDAPGNTDPDAPTQLFTDGIDGTEDKLDAVHPVASSSTPDVCADDDHAQELANGDVRVTGSQGSTQLSFPPESTNDDPPSSPTLLCDHDDANAPTQPFFGTCNGGPGPSSSIMNVWGRLESNASLGTNTAFVGHTGKEDLPESDAASDASKSLFNEEDEADSLCGEGEAGVLDSMEKGHRKLKEDGYHSDESTDLEDIPTDALPQTCHKLAGKAASSLQKEGPAAECYRNKERVITEISHKQALEGNVEEPRQSSITSSSSSRKEAPLTPTGQSTHSSTKSGRQHKVTKKLPFIPSETCTPESTLSQESVPVNVSLSDCFFDMSGESSETVHSIIPHKAEAGQPDWLSDSESEENATIQSQKLFDLPSDTEGDEAQGKEEKGPASPTRRRSSRLGTRQGSTPQSNRKKVSRASSAASVIPTCIHAKTSVLASLTPTSNPIPTSTFTTTVTTTITTPATPTSTNTPTTSTSITTSASTTTSTPTQPSAPACAPVPSVPLTSTTRRQTRRGRTEGKTSISTIDPVLIPISTRRHNKKSTPGGEVCPANNTVTTSICHATATSATTVTTPSTTDVTTTTFTSSQNMRGKRRTRSQRVTARSAVNARNVETEAQIESRELPQPSTSAATNIRSSSANTRSRRGRRATVSPMINIKAEVTEDENLQTTILTTIKQEKEPVEPSALEQAIIKTEPQDDLPQDNLHEEDSGRSMRTRRRPERFSPDRDISLPGRKLRSKISLPAPESSSRVLRENAGNAGMPTTGESSETPEDVPSRQRHSKRVLASMQSRRQEGGASVSNSEVTTLTVKVKEEREDSDNLSVTPIPSCSTLTSEADPPPKKGRQSRASTTRGARQAPPRAAKKIKMEVIPKEESDEFNLEILQSRMTQPRTKQKRISEYKKEEPSKRLSQNSFYKQRAKRSNSEASDSASSSNGSLSSRATRSNKDVELWSPSKRQRQASTKPRVLFTGYHDPSDHKIVTDLGGKVVETPYDCTVLVTTGLKRTCKLLSAIGMGRPIVNPNWLIMSKTAGNFVDPWEFLLKDREAEEKYGFCLEDTIKSASKLQLFEGIYMHATPSVQPPPCQMRDIVECAGGDYLHTPPKKYKPEIRIISCPEDKRLWPSFKSLGIPILGVEFILTGLLRHELLLEEFVLS